MPVDGGPGVGESDGNDRVIGPATPVLKSGGKHHACLNISKHTLKFSNCISKSANK